MIDQVKSATRTLEVLDYFETVRRPKGLKDICEALGFPQSSTTVLLKTLTSLGYLNYDRSRRLYLPTTKVATFGEWIPDALFGSSGVLEMMRDIVNATSETVVLAKRNDIYIEYVAAIPSPHELRFDVSVGSRRPIHHSPLGWLLLSAMKNKDAEQLVARAIAEEQESPDRMEHLLEQVDHAAAQGHVYGENTPFLGGATIGVLLPSSVDVGQLALGCGGVIERMRAGREGHLATIRSIVGLPAA
jgi:DNA-binding IclR family transcriptional regulator